MDQGDVIVNAVKESIRNGDDWHRALEESEAVTSHQVRSAWPWDSLDVHLCVLASHRPRH